MQAEIITIGDEILIGQVIDSNSAWISEQLNKIGVNVHQICSISDDIEHIVTALQEAENRADLVIITGGLGPTDDDITKKALCKYFDTKLVRNQDLYDKIVKFITKYGYELIERNLKQADLPEKCKLITNNYGSAPGMWFEKNNTIFISMPGVPFEMKNIMTNGVIPQIKSHFNTNTILHRTIMTHGIPESYLAEMLNDWDKQLSEKIKLAYLPSPEHVRLRMSISGDNIDELKQILRDEEEKIKKIIPQDIFAYDDQTLQEKIGLILKERKQTLSTAESCTGGNIAKLITSISGSSEYYEGSVVAYSNEIKNTVLGVKNESLIEHGAVSQKVVEEMALGVTRLMDTDYGIATSGVAGPKGGSKDKPVGTVWIAVASKNKVISEKTAFGNRRDFNIRHSTSKAIDMLRRFILFD